MIWEYTILSILSVVIVIFLDQKVFKTKLLLTKKYFYFFTLVIFLHTIVDNYLNGRWGFGSYIVGNYKFYSGLNIFFTPLENYLFGFSLISLNIILFTKYFKQQ
jgi:hypothetical protein